MGLAVGTSPQRMGHLDGQHPSSAKEACHLRAAEQAQQSLEFAAVLGGGVELEGNPASIKSISECIHCSNASSLSSCFSRISLAGSRRQLSIDTNERKRDNDEPDAPLPLDGEYLFWEADVVIAQEQSDQTNNAANNGFNQGFAVEDKPPPGWRRIPKIALHRKQPRPVTSS